MTNRPLEGKVALVTGAGRGIGREVALRLARDGARIIAHYAHSKSGAEETVARIAELGGSAVAYQADIARRPQVARMFGQIDADPGVLDIVVNCAGVSNSGALADVTDDQIDEIFGINLFGPLYIASEAARRLRDGGRIINFSSTIAKFPVGGAGLYGAAKSAVQSFTESWAKELGARGITVNTVIPGATSPGMIDASPEYMDYFAAASPFGRIGQAGEIAAVVAFLASPEANWVSGTHIMANGAATT